MNSYTGLHAQLTTRSTQTSRTCEARFVHELAGTQGGKLLDVACGTGRHARAFADLGYDVTASDINEELLAEGRDAAGDRVRFVQGDMCDLHVDGGPFDLVTCLFDSIGYPQENDGIVSALRSLGRHAPPGTIVFEFLHAPAILRGADPRRARVHPSDGRELVRTSETTLDVERMLMHVRYKLTLGDRSFSETQTNRVFSVPEMRLLAEAAGLVVREVVPAYSTARSRPTRSTCSSSAGPREGRRDRHRGGTRDRRSLHVPGDARRRGRAPAGGDPARFILYLAGYNRYAEGPLRGVPADWRRSGPPGPASDARRPGRARRYATHPRPHAARAAARRGRIDLVWFPTYVEDVSLPFVCQCSTSSTG